MAPANSKPRRAVQFINLSNSEARDRAPKRRATIRSHAARATHAMARQARVREYQASQGRTAQRQAQLFENVKTGSHEASQLVVQKAPDEVSDGGADAKMEAVVDRFVVGVPGSQQNDPFTSFAIAFTPIEHFLLTHCTYSPFR